MCAQHLPSCCCSGFSEQLSPLSNLDTRMATRYQDKLRQELNNGGGGGGNPEEKGEGGELRMTKRFRAFETRTVKSLPKIGNTEREVDSGYIEDVLFWVCADYSCGEV